MSKPRIIINVHGGLVQDVFSSDPQVEVTLIDWDTQSHNPDEPSIVQVDTHSGRRELACVADFPISPFSELAGTDVELALKKAKVSDGPT